jgi:hypothetical protein
MQKFPAGAWATVGVWPGEDAAGIAVLVSICEAFPNGATGRLASIWKELVMSRVPLRNSLIILPMLRPLSGNFLGPKISKATRTMITIWMGWIPKGIWISFSPVNSNLSFEELNLDKTTSP